MRLPERLDYFEVPFDVDGVQDWVPKVYCEVEGCEWSYPASWCDLGTDGDVDWDKEHPAHG